MLENNEIKTKETRFCLRPNRLLILSFLFWIMFMGVLVEFSTGILGLDLHLTGRLVVYYPPSKPEQILKYETERIFNQFHPVIDPEEFRELEQKYSIYYNPIVSPDGRWSLSFDRARLRYVVSGPDGRFSFRYHCLSPGELAWSPNGKFIAYAANDDQGEWTGRIMVMSLKNGKTWWVGKGYILRWYP